MKENKSFLMFSNYCGPGGSGSVQHSIDEECKIHDEAYGDYQKRGVNPYIVFNKSDRDLARGVRRKKPSGIREYVSKLGVQGFVAGKRIFAPELPSNLELPVPELPSNVAAVQSFAKVKVGMKRPRTFKPKYRKRRYKRKARRTSRYLTKKIKRVVQRQTFGKPWVTREVQSFQHSSSVNTVGWNQEDIQCSKYSSLKQICSTDDDSPTFWGLNDTHTSMDVIRPDLFSGTYATLINVKFKVKKMLQYRIRNNTNFPQYQTWYVVKCLAYTEDTTLNDLDKAYQSSLKDSTTGDYAKDPFQYWSVRGVGESKRKYKLVKRFDVSFNPGEEKQFTVKLPSFIFSPAVANLQSVTDNTFMKGSYQIVRRTMGAPMHDSTTTTNTGLANSSVDVVRRQFISVALKNNSMEVSKHQMDTRTGFTATVPIIADKDGVDVDAFENT